MKTWTDDAKAHVNRYLRQVQVLIEGGGADAHEVVEDLSRHIHQRANDSPNVVITIDEAKRIVASMGSPEEVALSWKQLGAEADKEIWDAPDSSPTAKASGNARSSRVALAAGVVTLVLVAAALPFVVWYMRYTVPEKSGPRNEGGTTAARVESRGPIQAKRAAAKKGANRSQPMETQNQWQPGWFQAGSNHTDFVTGTATGVEGMEKAMFIRALRPNAAGFSTVMTQVAADPYRGKRVRLTGSVESAVENGTAGMWMRIDALDGRALGFDNMSDRPITGHTPVTPYTIDLDVPADAVSIAYGMLFSGQGAVWFGDMAIVPMSI
jgi:hypothetical protein